MMKNLLLFLFICFSYSIFAGEENLASLDIPTENNGISIGNSRNFTGLRINFRDRDVERIRGVNITLCAVYRKRYQSASSTAPGN